MAPRPVELLQEILELAAQSDRELRATQSPHEKYQKEVEAVQARIRDIWESLPSASSQLDQAKLRDELVACGGKLEVLKAQYQATVIDEETLHGQQQWATVEKLCCKLVTTLGEAMVKRSLQCLSSNATPPTITVGLPRSQESTQIGADHESDKGQSSTSDVAGAKTAAPNIEPTNKRHIDDDVTSRPCKRHQVSTNSPSAEAKQSVNFTDVFQGGHAQTKYVIVQFPKGSDKWYILRCNEHALRFKDNPLMGAAAHLGSKKHGQLPREHAVVIEHLGVLVLGCDERSADKNNIVARKAFLSRAVEQPATIQAEKQLERDSLITPTASLPSRQVQRTRKQLLSALRSNHGRKSHQSFEGIAEPIRGQIYLGFWEMSRAWSAILLLPTEDLEHVGVPGTMEDLGLAEKVPSCYDYDRRTKMFKWRVGYEDGGHLVSQREFPVMYFDGVSFPAKSAVGWLPAKNLRAFDPDAFSSSLIPNLNQVRKYLKEREEQPLAETDGSEAVETVIERPSSQGNGQLLGETPSRQAQSQQPPTTNSRNSINHPSDTSDPCSTKPPAISSPADINAAGMRPSLAGDLQDLDGRSQQGPSTDSHKGRYETVQANRLHIVTAEVPAHNVDLNTTANYRERSTLDSTTGSSQLASIMLASPDELSMVPEKEPTDNRVRTHSDHATQGSRTLPNPPPARWPFVSGQSFAPPQLPHSLRSGAAAGQQGYGNGAINANMLYRRDDAGWSRNTSSSMASPQFPEPRQWDMSSCLEHPLPPILVQPPDATDATPTGFVERPGQDGMLRHDSTALRTGARASGVSIQTKNISSATVSMSRDMQPGSLSFGGANPSQQSDIATAFAGLPQRIVNQLNEQLGHNQKIKAGTGLRNSRGFFVCPLCSKTKEYTFLGNFRKHLGNH